ncbi:hypothetical protein EJK55_1365 [Moraxella catarrhalis]|uniref:Uncharacterized protein n=1 Tax=Moraxella catarrhalis TaxID=480 RepID=A0A3Q9GDW6_MORCA|nr:hypothetical protein MCR_0986 [Moraxella catarrhalis BBH18]AZQ87920.1 hypothetical protein EJK52_1036 [Moraxella catarrhalis]AZQ89060.1 hypothetical protein EJK50_1088 [Moraxella catarrhalis]AZQ91370.1 hypothetical protein EJK51_1034 [Moraxella catarrhalis]AZQ93703.1 hypothetical protein EJK53_1112 [Moraxella catarrhalis]
MGVLPPLLDGLYYSLKYIKSQVIITVLYEIVMIIWLFYI